jgi:hypothetical protein
MDYESIDRLKQVLEIKIKKTRSDIRHDLYNKAYNAACRMKYIP